MMWMIIFDEMRNNYDDDVGDDDMMSKQVTISMHIRPPFDATS